LSYFSLLYKFNFLLLKTYLWVLVCGVVGGGAWIEPSPHACSIARVQVFFFPVLGFELRAYTSSHSTSPFFVIEFFEIGSQELFAWADFKS
jgi:hypothetical protein